MSTLLLNEVQSLTGKKILGTTGSILQVVQVVKNDTFTAAANGTALLVTGLAASITPTNSNNKIWILGHIMYSSTGTTYGGWMTRNGTAIGLGLSASGQQQVSMGMSFPGDSNQSNTFVYSFLDSPGTTSSVTYQFYVNNDNGNAIYINRSVNDQGNTTGKRGISTITLLEVVA
jgi:hypothetical protein